MNVLKHILFIAMSISAISLHAATFTWQGTTDTDWETATNWSGGAVPTAEDDVIIPGGLSCYPTAAAASVCRYLYMASGARLAGQELLTYEKAFVDVTLPANRYEDAPLFDAAGAAFTFATLAGQQVVGVNVLPVWDNIPLFITDNATLTFNGIDTYEQPLVLFDAIENKEYALTEGCNVALTVNSGEEAGRWFIRKPAGIASDCRQTTDGGKLTAWNPQKGTLVVRTADEACNVSLFAMSGQRIAATEADGLATFHNVPTGTYLIVVTANGKTQQLKTSVR